MSKSEARKKDQGRKGRVNPKGIRRFWSPKTKQEWRAKQKNKKLLTQKQKRRHRRTK